MRLNTTILTVIIWLIPEIIFAQNYSNFFIFSAGYGRGWDVTMSNSSTNKTYYYSDSNVLMLQTAYRIQTNDYFPITGFGGVIDGEYSFQKQSDSQSIGCGFDILLLHYIKLQSITSIVHFNKRLQVTDDPANPQQTLNFSGVELKLGIFLEFEPVNHCMISLGARTKLNMLSLYTSTACFTAGYRL